MKKHLAVLAATAVLGVTSAFAANPFSDVTPQDWAYQAVAQLASQGIVNGYPDGTFQGQTNITRYEMAQMVAKALVRQDRVDAEQNAIINRLANEFSAELNNLGVRVSTLENKVGNFKFTGDARLRYGNKVVVDNKTKAEARKSKFDYRGRVKFEATVNDNTKAVIRLVGEKEFGKQARPKTAIDQVYVQHNFGQYVTATAGRQNLMLGNGLAYDDTLEGVVATFGKDKLNATVGYGYLMGGDTFESLEKDANFEVNSYQVNYTPVENVAVKAYAVDFHNNKAGNTVVGKAPNVKVVKDFHGVAADVNFGGHNQAWVGGEYVRAEQQSAAGEAWTAGLGYGEASMAKAGTWGVKAQYFDVKGEAPLYSSTWNFVNKDQKGFLATVDYTVAKNVGLSAYATIDTKNQANESKPEAYRAELNYKF